MAHVSIVTSKPRKMACVLRLAKDEPARNLHVVDSAYTLEHVSSLSVRMIVRPLAHVGRFTAGFPTRRESLPFVVDLRPRILLSNGMQRAELGSEVLGYAYCIIHRSLPWVNWVPPCPRRNSFCCSVDLRLCLDGPSALGASARQSQGIGLAISGVWLHAHYQRSVKRGSSAGYIWNTGAEEDRIYGGYDAPI